MSRRDLTLILAISVVSVASRCPSHEPPRKVPSSAGERFPLVSELASRTGLPDPLVMKPEGWKAFLDYADKHLGPPAKPRSAARGVALLGTPSSGADDRQAPHGLEYQAVPHVAGKVLRTLIRCVRRRVGDAQEETIGRMLANEPYRLVGHQVSEQARSRGSAFGCGRLSARMNWQGRRHATSDTRRESVSKTLGDRRLAFA